MDRGVLNKLFTSSIADQMQSAIFIDNSGQSSTEITQRVSQNLNFDILRDFYQFLSVKHPVEYIYTCCIHSHKVNKD